MENTPSKVFKLKNLVTYAKLVMFTHTQLLAFFDLIFPCKFKCLLQH